MTIEQNRHSVLQRLAGAGVAPRLRGIVSVCSAHPLVVEAALRRGLKYGVPVLVEATCNQVNHDGGYTGMTPAAFRRFVEGIAADVGFPSGRLILGGDHLGPNPWRSMPAAEAMSHAETMIAAFVTAGFHKLHLDCSMGCEGEAAALDDEEAATRAARLAAIAERHATERGMAPVYVIGTEVPPPGGATHSILDLAVTSSDAVPATINAHLRAFSTYGVAAAFARIIGVVVQPGVEFGNTNVVPYLPERARPLSDALATLPGIVYEAHSTDYQPASALRALVDDGFGILKVGPALTFALREALYGLDAIAGELHGCARTLAPAMETLMLSHPKNWAAYYGGTESTQRVQRHFSYSDRIRYYWPYPEALAAVDDLLSRLAEQVIPEPLISQYLTRVYPAVLARQVPAMARDLCLASIEAALEPYYAAVLGGNVQQGLHLPSQPPAAIVNCP